MNEKYLYEILDALEQVGTLKEIPEIIGNGLSNKIELREYQKLAFRYFITYFENEKLKKNKQVHTLFHMATGSGKTVIMAGIILYLYTKGYNKFLFFVNQTNILEKTKENFINSTSSKYLFNNEINYLGNNIKIKMVDNFSTTTLSNDSDIEICFTSTQKLHMDLFEPKENGLTYRDFEDNKIVFISDESHHINTLTKKESKNTAKNEEINSWEYSVTSALNRNKDSIMLEFTATANLKDKNVEQKYKDKIVFDYPLRKFRESGYTKDFKNFATESELWDRTLMALIISEYRKFLFSDLKLDIKPVIMLKSKTIKESQTFYAIFFDKIKNLSIDEINKFYNINTQEENKKENVLYTKQLMTKILEYFKSKDESLNLLLNSVKASFTKETSIIMNGATDNNRENQLLINSLEDKDNPIRVIFAVDMLNEGWDVLNLFDIVRLYDAGSKEYTTKEAQLIGRGARYCPFKLDDEQDKFKRKFDSDLNNDYRILETMLFHSKDDSKYIKELRQALIESGLEEENRIELNYILKPEFKKTEFYQKTYVYSNKRKVKSRENVTSLEENFKNKSFSYTVKDNQGYIYSLIDKNTNFNHEEKTEKLKFEEIDYNILLGASEKYSAFKFNVIKNKYPNVKTMREFLTTDAYLGNIRLEINYLDKLTGKDIFNACIYAFGKISNYIISIKEEFEGTKEFYPKQLKNVIKDKKVYISSKVGDTGKGNSQNNCIDKEYALDLSKKDWYVFNDNYGTSEEKAFIKYFETDIVPKLDKNLEFYVIRNERISDLAIYNFDNGERFEPDYLLFIKKKDSDNSTINQIYAEPKGSHLLDNDSWKEKFLLKIDEKSKIDSVFSDGDDYKVIGLPFFNKTEKINEFEEAISNLIENI